MDIHEFARRFPEKIKELEDFVKGDAIKDIAGMEAVKHFKDSFVNEGFTDENLQKWPDVKRRDPESAWFGHSGQTGKFSQTRTLASILNGETSELKEATTYTKTATGVRVYNEKPCAHVHNFGGQAKIYGKKAFQMLARPFIGKSAVLKTNIRTEIRNRIKDILKL